MTKDRGRFARQSGQSGGSSGGSGGGGSGGSSGGGGSGSSGGGGSSGGNRNGGGNSGNNNNDGNNKAPPSPPKSAAFPLYGIIIVAIVAVIVVVAIISIAVYLHRRKKGNNQIRKKPDIEAKKTKTKRQNNGKSPGRDESDSYIQHQAANGKSETAFANGLYDSDADRIPGARNSAETNDRSMKPLPSRLLPSTKGKIASDSPETVTRSKSNKALPSEPKSTNVLPDTPRGPTLPDYIIPTAGTYIDMAQNSPKKTRAQNQTPNLPMSNMNGGSAPDEQSNTYEQLNDEYVRPTPDSTYQGLGSAHASYVNDGESDKYYELIPTGYEEPTSPSQVSYGVSRKF